MTCDNPLVSRCPASPSVNFSSLLVTIFVAVLIFQSQFQPTLAIKCYQCINIEHPPHSDPTCNNVIENYLATYADQYLNIKSRPLTHCPDPDDEPRWRMLEASRTTCLDDNNREDRSASCVASRFEVSVAKYMYLNRTKTKDEEINTGSSSTTTYGTILGCGAKVHRKLFEVLIPPKEGSRPGNICILTRGREYIALKPDEKNTERLHHFIFENCRTVNNEQNCQNCDNCRERDFCINKYSTRARRLIFEDGNANSVIVMFIALGISLLIVIAAVLCAGDSPDFKPHGVEVSDKKMKKLGIKYYEYNFVNK